MAPNAYDNNNNRNVLTAVHADTGLDMFLEELKTEKNRVRHTVHKTDENTYGRLPSEDVGIETYPLTTDVKSSVRQNLFLHRTGVICTHQ